MNLNHHQQSAVAKLDAVLTEYNSAFLHAGLRTNHAGMVQAYVERYGKHYKQVSIMHPNFLLFNDFTQCWNRKGSDVLYNKMPNPELDMQALVIVPYALWQPNSWGIMLLGQERGHKILGVGTNGDHGLKGREWLGMEPPQRMSYKTSDLNPDVDLAALRAATKPSDVARFERDYLNY